MHVEFGAIQKSLKYLRNEPSSLAPLQEDLRIFSKFSKFHETCRIFLNQNLKHACEMLLHLEILILKRKMASARDLMNRLQF